jgi:hypothetical protein
MTQENKKILFQDLSARLPYHVKCKIWLKDGTTEEGLLDLQHNYGNVLQDAFYYNKIKDIKPYLRPMSSMTEEEHNELKHVALVDNEGIPGDIPAYIDWLNEHHFDYRGLIEDGLALDCTGLNIYN